MRVHGRARVSHVAHVLDVDDLLALHHAEQLRFTLAKRPDEGNHRGPFIFVTCHDAGACAGKHQAVFLLSAKPSDTSSRFDRIELRRGLRGSLFTIELSQHLRFFVSLPFDLFRLEQLRVMVKQVEQFVGALTHTATHPRLLPERGQRCVVAVRIAVVFWVNMRAEMEDAMVGRHAGRRRNLLG